MKETDIRRRALESSRELIRLLGGQARGAPPGEIVFAESCTAGLVSDFLAQVPGASRVLWGSFVCYTPQAKIAMLGLDGGRLSRFGLVSGETACDMAAGALAKSGAKIAAAVTGLAGPGGDGSPVEVGTVWVAAARQDGGGPLAQEFFFEGARGEIRLQAALATLEFALGLLLPQVKIPE